MEVSLQVCRELPFLHEQDMRGKYLIVGTNLKRDRYGILICTEIEPT